MTTFGTHPINNTTFSGGLDIDDGQTFTVDMPLGDTATAVGSIGKRGLGTLNLNSTINLRGGQTFWDAGVVNVNSTVTLHSLHLRSPVVNIGTGGSVTTDHRLQQLRPGQHRHQRRAGQGDRQHHRHRPAHLRRTTATSTSPTTPTPKAPSTSATAAC